MEKSRQYLQSLGICQWLFDLIMNSLFAKGLKRITLGHPAPPDKGNSAADNAPEFAETQVSEDSGSEIHVQFQQTEDSEYWDFWKVEKDDQVKPISGSVAEGSKKTTKKKNRRKVSIAMEEAKHKGPAYRHLLSVTSNVNEKSEAFIRHRKEEMTKASSNLTHL